MRFSRIFAVSVLGSALAVLSSCADLSKYVTQSNELASSVGPRLEGLWTSASGLKDRAMKLPADVPGVAELQSNATTHLKDLESLKSSLSAFPSRIDEAAKNGDADQVTKLLEEQRASSTTSVANAEIATGKLKTQVVNLEGVAARAAEAKARTAEAPAAPSSPDVFNKTLPGGYSLQANPSGIESQLITFVEDRTRPVDKTTWFDFDRLSFKTGSAELDLTKSKEQLTNIAEILKAYPSVKIKVGGYTDNTGKVESNKKLSGLRAQAVAKVIAGMGVKTDRIDPEGYGSDHPVCPANDTESCREKNRRISVRVTNK